MNLLRHFSWHLGFSMSEQKCQEVVYKQIFGFKCLFNCECDFPVTDVKLVVNDSSIPCHKSVLAAESPYFKAMFSSNMKESHQEEITLQGLDFDALSLLINYFYTYEIKLSERNIYRIVEVADFLQVTSIRPLCDRFLCEIIKPDNCIIIHDLADCYGYYDVSIRAFHCILNNFSILHHEKEFLVAPFHTVSKVFSSRVIDAENEDQIFEAMRKWIDYDIESRRKHVPELFKMIHIDELSNRDSLEFERCLVNYTICDNNVDFFFDIKNFRSRQIYKCILKGSQKDETTKDPSCYPRRSKTPLEICFAIGGYTFDDKENCVPLRCVEVLHHGSENKWKFSVPQCLQNSVSSSFNNCEGMSVGTMAHCRTFAAIASSDKYVYIIGGNDGLGPMNHAERYDPITNKWEAIAPFPYKLDGAAAAFANGKIYVSGGYNQNIGVNNKVWAYDEGCKSWRECVSMRIRRVHHALVSLHGVLYAIGGCGYDGRPMASVECLFIGMENWIEATPLKVPRSHLACAVYCDKIYAVCGKNSVPLGSTEVYDVLTNKWVLFKLSTGNKFLGCIYGHGACMFKDYLLIVGGRTSTCKASEAVYKLNFRATSPIWYGTDYLIRSRVALSVVTLKLY